MSQTASSYDVVPYNSVPFKQSHPTRLATVATLMGLTPPPVATARVLELGCGCGDNLMPLALEWPDAQLLGIDLSQRHVDMAAEVIAELGLKNVRIEQGDILELPSDLGEFDYVIAHGVYSWLPDAVRDALMAACFAHLAPDGIAYVSYNALPGWRQRGTARDALLFHTRSVSEPAQRIRESQAFIEFMGRVVPDGIPGYRSLWLTLLDRIDSPEARHALLYHDFLEPDNTPVYFSQFAAHAARHALRFVAEARLSDMTLHVLGEEVRTRLAALDDDVVTREQYRDFVVNRQFRQSLLCHESRAPRAWPDPEAMHGMYIASELVAEEGGGEADDERLMRFARDGTTVGLQQPIIKIALLVLRDSWPHPLSFDELLARARAQLRPDGVMAIAAQAWHEEQSTLASELLELYQADLVEVDIAPARFSSTPGERPRAAVWALHQARSGGLVCNLRHNVVELDALPAALLKLLDGRRDLAALARDLAEAVADKGLVLSEDGRAVDDPAEQRAVLVRRLPGMLDRLAHLALLAEAPAGTRS